MFVGYVFGLGAVSQDVPHIANSEHKTHLHRVHGLFTVLG
jgi:hypothetical protein